MSEKLQVFRESFAMRRFALPAVYVLTMLCLILSSCTEDISEPLTHEAVLGKLRESPQEPPQEPPKEPTKEPPQEPEESSRIAFVVEADTPQIYLINPGGTELTPLASGVGYAPFWSPDGEIAFYSFEDFSFHVIGLDGASSAIALNQFAGVTSFEPHFSWSRSGRIALTIMDVNTESWDIFSMDTKGADLIRLTLSPAWCISYYPSWSPDGTEVVFAFEDSIGNSNIYLVDANGADVKQITFTREDYQPVWSPDGQRIAFVSDRELDYEIYVMDADGANQINLTNNFADDERPTWSPDGQRIAFQSDRNGDYEIYVMNADGTNQVNITNNPAADDVMPAWSQ